MRFNDKTILFNINDIPVIGNFDSGSLIGLTSEGKLFCESIFKQDVKPENVTTKNKVLFKTLLEAGFFKENNAKTKMSAYLHVTQRCNLHCVGCYSLDRNRNCLKDPSVEQIIIAINELARNNCELLVLSGGEPFLRKDLEEILKYAKEVSKIPNIQIITNGTKVLPDTLKKIKNYVNGIAVSIDGYSENNPTFIRDSGIFDSVIKAIQYCKAEGINTSILPTIHRKNSDLMREYVKLSKELGVGISYSLLTCSPKDEILKDWLPNSEQLQNIAMEIIEIGMEGSVSVNDMPIGDGLDVRKSCEVGSKIVSVGADGSVYPCHMLHNDNLLMGNIFIESLSHILQSDLAKQCRNLHVDDFKICSTCKHKYICGGGCRARSYYVHGDLTSHDFYCPMTKTYFDWISNRLSEMYK